MKKSKWTKNQIEMLLDKTKAGGVRVHAFRDVAKLTKRKTNSVRNFYYKLVASGQTGHQKKVFTVFDDGEVKNLVREVVLGTSRGESVRSVCFRLADGDKTGMLRLQNKYRAILAKRPQLIVDMSKLLEAQGFFVKSPVESRARKTVPAQDFAKIIMMPEVRKQSLSDADINNLFMGLMRLVTKRADDQIATLKAEIERLKSRGKSSNMKT